MTAPLIPDLRAAGMAAHRLYEDRRDRAGYAMVNFVQLDGYPAFRRRAEWYAQEAWAARLERDDLLARHKAGQVTP